MPKFKKNLFTISFICLLLSCGKQPCYKANSILGLVSFSAAESDTVVLRRFVKATNFASLKDTFILSAATGNFQMSNDTLLILQYVDQYNAVVSTYDYEVSLPKANRVFKISDVMERITSINGGLGKLACINPIISYKVDGQLISGDKNYDIIYLKK